MRPERTAPSVDHHVDFIPPGTHASRTSISFTLSEARPDGNDVATDATATGEEPNTDGVRDEVGVDAHGGDRRDCEVAGSGRIALVTQ